MSFSDDDEPLRDERDDWQVARIDVAKKGKIPLGLSLAKKKQTPDDLKIAFRELY